MKAALHVLTLTLAGGLLASCTKPAAPPVEAPPAEPASVVQVRGLDQGWDEQTQASFWFTSQGSQILPYAWFLALERAQGTEPFRSDAHMSQLGYLPAPAGPGSWNPDGLPIGFTRGEVRDKKAWLGLSCAACHTGQVNYKGVGLRIDGGPALSDFNGFYTELAAALQATLDDAAKFQRFAQALGAGDEAAKGALRQALEAQAKAVQERLNLNHPSHPAGHGRVDAFGNIFNEVMAVALAQPQNGQPPDAPVSYPFLWDTPQHEKVQWNGSAPNGPMGLGELARNVGEVLGVFGGLRVQDCRPPLSCRYPSSVDLRGAGRLEGWLRGLWSPLWEESVLGPIDRTLAQRGAELYQAQCLSCHQLIDRRDPYRRVKLQLHDVGTDPAMASAAATRAGSTGPLKGVIELGSGKPFGEQAGAAALLGQAALGVMLDDVPATIEALASEYDAQVADELRGGERYKQPAGWSRGPRPSAESLKTLLQQRKAAAKDAAAVLPGPNAVYKARPLNGIWATAPYLHNGSVPDLQSLLQPAAQRPQTFHVGGREFDPARVGFRSDTGPFLYDTRLSGNSNAGHEKGTGLSDADKKALLEYLKTL